MKKLLGISLIAVLAVSPMMAKAVDATATEPTAANPVADTNVAAKGPQYALQPEVAADSTSLATAKYVKGAYNAAIKAVNKVAADATSGITSAINNLDSTVSQTAGADGLALTVVEENGKITSVTGSIAANTYDAYGAADDALTSANAYTDGKITALSSVYDAKGAADTALTSAKAYTDEEATRAKAAEAALNTAIGSETTRATAAESALDTRINALETANSTFATKTQVTANINAATASASNVSLDVAGSVTGNVPAMLEWGDTSASSIALASGTIASGAKATGDITDIDVSAPAYVE